MKRKISKELSEMTFLYPSTEDPSLDAIYLVKFSMNHNQLNKDQKVRVLKYILDELLQDFKEQAKQQPI